MIFDTGLSFSVLPPTTLPGSLKNIYKQMAADISTFKVPATGLAHNNNPFLCIHVKSL